jgi:hypothetical protein
MHDRPRLVEAVDERSRTQRWAPLLEAAADTDETVAEREDGLCALGELVRVPRLPEPPLVGRVETLRRQDDLTLEHDSKVIPRARYGQTARITITLVTRPGRSQWSSRTRPPVLTRLLHGSASCPVCRFPSSVGGGRTYSCSPCRSTRAVSVRCIPRCTISASGRTAGKYRNRPGRRRTWVHSPGR